MGVSEYVSIPCQNKPEEVALAAATAVYDGDSPPLTKATKEDPLQSVDELSDEIMTITWETGEVQTPAYRDKWFAIAFIAHLLVVLGAGMAFGPAVLAEGAEAEEVSVDVDDGVDVGSEDSLQNFHEAPPKEYWFAVVAIALLSSPALSFVALTIMSR